MPKQAEKSAKELFLEGLAAFNTTEITWAFQRLADTSKENIKSLELDILRHQNFNRPDKAKECLERINFNEKLIALRDLWRDAECEYSAPMIVAAVMGMRGK